MGNYQISSVDAIHFYLYSYAVHEQVLLAMKLNETFPAFVREKLSILNVLSTHFDEAVQCSIISSLVTPEIHKDCLCVIRPVHYLNN